MAARRRWATDRSDRDLASADSRAGVSHRAQSPASRRSPGSTSCPAQQPADGQGAAGQGRDHEGVIAPGSVAPRSQPVGEDQGPADSRPTPAPATAPGRGSQGHRQGTRAEEKVAHLAGSLLPQEDRKEFYPSHNNQANTVAAP